MDFHDFPGCLGKSGCISHPPPSSVQAYSEQSSRTIWSASWSPCASACASICSCSPRCPSKRVQTRGKKSILRTHYVHSEQYSTSTAFDSEAPKLNGSPAKPPEGSGERTRFSSVMPLLASHTSTAFWRLAVNSLCSIFVNGNS